MAAARREELICQVGHDGGNCSAFWPVAVFVEALGVNVVIAAAFAVAAFAGVAAVAGVVTALTASGSICPSCNRVQIVC